MKILRFFILLGLVLSAIPAAAQTALTTTTISTAVADPAQRTVVVASATGISAGTGLFVAVTGELMTVTSISGTTATVNRGDEGTRAFPIAASAVVIITPAAASVNRTFEGSCTGANLPQYFQYVNPTRGTYFVCMAAGLWQERDARPLQANHTTPVITR